MDFSAIDCLRVQLLNVSLRGFRSRASLVLQQWSDPAGYHSGQLQMMNWGSRTLHSIFFLKAISAPSKSLISLVDCGQCGFLWFSTCNDLQVIPSNITVTYSPHEPPKWIHPIHLTFRLGGYWIVLGEWVFRYLKVPIISQFKFYFVDFCGLITIHYIKLYSQFPIISPSINPQCIPIFWFEKPFAIQFFGILVADRAVP